MRRIICAFAVGLSGCSACGHTAIDNEVIGQVKKVSFNTPLICPDYVSTDLSLGVLRNGVGSMSTADQWFVVTNDKQYQILRHAVESGQLVKAHYDVRRVTMCIEDHILTKVELIAP